MTLGLFETVESIQKETKPLGHLSAEFQLQRIRRLCAGVLGFDPPRGPSSKDAQIEALSESVGELEKTLAHARHELVRLRGIAAYVEADE